MFTEVSQDDHRRLGVARRAYTRTFDESVDCITSVHSLDVFGRAEEEYDANLMKDVKKALGQNVSGDVAYVKAPAFFGESCLWNDDPEPADYGCKTLTRCEFTTITRPDVDYVIAELPYLQPRFLAFRDYVSKSMATLVSNNVVDARNNSKDSKDSNSWQESTKDDDADGFDKNAVPRIEVEAPPPANTPQQHPSFVPDPMTKSEPTKSRNVGWID
jgi:hypothetical protein